MSDQDPRHDRDEANPPADDDARARAAAEGADAQQAAGGESIEELIRQRDDALEQLRRSQAEFLNYQRRIRSQAEAEKPYAIGPLAMDLLTVIDNFERALEAARQSGAEAIVTGLELVHRHLLETLAKHGVEPIDALGRPFDPNFHEALTQMPDPEQPEGNVVAEMSRGYAIRDRVLRPSRVAVSSGPS